MMGVKNKIAMISLSALLFNANHMSGMETIKRGYEKVKKTITSPITKVRQAARNLQADMACVYKNACTQVQKDRIKSRMKVLLTILGIAALIGGGAYVLSKSDALQHIYDEYQNLPDQAKVFLEKIYDLSKKAIKNLQSAIDDVKQQSRFIKLQGLKAALSLLDLLTGFEGKKGLRDFLALKEAEKLATPLLTEKAAVDLLLKRGYTVVQ